MKQIITNSIFGLIFGFLGAGIFFWTVEKKDSENPEFSSIKYDDDKAPFIRSMNDEKHEDNTSISNRLISDFSNASHASTSSVVFIQTSSEVDYRGGRWVDWFFEPRSETRAGSGSGVIMTSNGYIVTNNHVIEGADIIKVIHGKNSYEGILVGTDPSTDIAVIKVKAENLPEINIGSSKDVRVGEWVLAVGNPFNLESTVTAGIVSAKGRNINILKDKFPIESFIQTDAAINPGNSGGALVNIDGDLIGINTAILSRTGSYAGYGFAVPVDIVKKVFDDIKEFGQVQKAFIGADYIDIDSDLASRLDISDISGVIISHTQEGSAAYKAGIKKWDVIRKVNDVEIKHKGYIEEIIGNSSPGDILAVTVDRSGKIFTKNVILTNKEGTTALLKDNSYFSEFLKASFTVAPKVERDLYGIDFGIKVLKVDRDGLFKRLDIPKNFIITSVNGNAIKSPEEFEKVISNVSGLVNISVISEQGRRMRYPYRF